MGDIDASHGKGMLFGDHGSVNNFFGVPLRRRIEWPVRVGLPPPLAHCLQDRAVSELLTGTIVLFGLGGVGKSQLAAQLADRRWKTKTVDLLMWVPASSQSAIVTGYAEAASRLGIAQGQQGESAAARLLEWLAGTDRRWLVILDDLTDPADLHTFWPPSSWTGSTVVTTRRRDAALAGHGRRFVEVGLFSSEEASAYLHAKLEPSLADDVDGVAADLGRLPLALAQAAAYMLDEGIPCSRYRELLTDRTRRLDELAPSSLPDDHRQTVDITWSLSIQAANRQRPTKVAEPLLQWASLLDPEGIPETVMYTPSTLDYLGSACGEPVTAEMVRQAARCLHRYSLASHDPGNPARCLRVHAIIQRSTREQAGQALLDVATRAAAGALVEAWPEIEIDPALGQALRANANMLAAIRPDPLWTEPKECHEILFRAGMSLGEIGEVAAAAEYYRRLHDVARGRLGPDHPHTLTARYNLAYWQGQAGDPATAATAYAELLADRLRVLGPDHPHTLTTRGNLAYWRGQTGDPAAAATALADLLADQLRVLGPDHPHTLTTRGNLAYWRGQTGDPATAAATYAELLTDHLRVLGPDHPHTLTTRGNLANWRGQTGDPAAAATALADLLTDQLRVLGPGHANTLITRSNLAHWQGEAGDPLAAANAFAALLTDRLRVLGPDHPDTLITRENLAYWEAASRGVVGHGLQGGDG